MGVKIGERCTVYRCKKKIAPDTDLCRHHLAQAIKAGKCAFIGCGNTAIERNNGFCAEHNKPKGQIPDEPAGVLTALCAAVAAKYKAEGDVTKAGVVVAELSHNPPRFYASIARYPHGPLHKQVVCKVGQSQPILTAENAVCELAQKFSEENRPLQVRKRLEELDAVLGIENHDTDMEHT